MIIHGSSQIHCVDYDAINHRMTVTFHSGGRYRYEPVSATQHTQFLNANSKGKWLDENIKKNDKIITTKLSKNARTGYSAAQQPVITSEESSDKVVLKHIPESVIYVGEDLILNEVKAKDLTKKSISSDELVKMSSQFPSA